MHQSLRTSLFFKVILTLASAFLVCITPAGAEDTKVQPLRERFVPVDQLDAILRQNPSGVLLPKAEFQELLLQARQAQGEVSPGKAAMTSANYKLSAAKHRAIIELTIQFRQFRDGWTTQTIPIGNLQPESATLNGKIANVGTVENQPGRLVILNNTSGTFELKVTLSTPLLKSGTDRTVVFKALDKAIATLSVICPAGEQVILNSRKLERKEQLTKATTYSVPIGQTLGKADDVRVTWTTRRRQAMSDNLVFAKSNIEASLNTSGLKWNCESRLSVFGEKIDRLTASVPAALEITDVESAGLEQWTLENDPDANDRVRLQLKYRQPFTEDRLIRIAAVSTLTLQNANASQTSASKIPTLLWNQLTAHTGQIAVRTESTERLLSEPVSGLDRITNAQRSSTDRLIQADVFNFWKQDFDLKVGVRPKDRELFSNINSVLSVVDTGLNFQSTLTIETLNEPLFNLLIDVPKDWQIQSLLDDSSTELNWSRTVDGTSIFVDLPKPVEAGSLLELRLLFSRTIQDPSVSQTVSLPVVRIQDAIQAAATYTITCANDLKLSFPELAGLVPIADANNRLVFEAQVAKYGGTIQIDRQIARMATRTELRTWMDPDTVSTTIDLTVDIVNGSTQNLTVSLPESLTKQVRFQVRAIGQVPGQQQAGVPRQVQIIEQTALPAVDGVRPFLLTFDKRFVGSVNLYANVKVDRDENFDWSAPFARINEASRQQGILVFEARPEQQLAVVDRSSMKGVTTADASMVAACDVRSGRRVAMVFRYVKADYSLTVDGTTFETQAVPSAVCQSIQNIVVYDAQQTVQRSAKINFQTSGVQTLRFRLPENSYLWSTVLDGQAVQVRRDNSDYLVSLPLPAIGSMNQSHQLQILFQNQASESETKAVVQDSVTLLIDTNEGPSIDVEILQQEWKLSYPKTSSLTEIPDGFQLEGGLQRQGWIQSAVQSIRMFRRPSNQTMIERTVPSLLALLALFVVTVLVTRRRYRTLFILSIVFAVVGLLSTSRSISSRTPTTETAYADTAVDGPEAEDALGPNWGNPKDVAQQQTQPSDNSITFSNQLGAPMDGGGFGGGLGGGGLGGGGMGNGTGGFGGGEADKMTSDVVITNSADISNAGQQLADDPFGEMIPVPRVNNNIGQLHETRTLERNSAVLSVKTNVANPDHFLSAKFRSINSSTTRQSFPVKLQSAQTRQGLMIIAAAAVALLCLFFSKANMATRLTIVTFLTLTIAALVPLLNAEWQPVADGMLFGLGIGILIWISLGLVRLCASCCRPRTLVQLGNVNRRTAKSASTAAMLLLCWISGKDSVNAQQSPANQQAIVIPNQAANTAPTANASDDLQSNFQPDVVLPYEPGQPELLADKVFLPKEQFLKLYRLANPNQQSLNGTKSTAHVVAAFYKGAEIRQTDNEKWVQQFDARFVINAMSDQSTWVPLPITNVSLISATILTDASQLSDTVPEERPALIVPTGDGGFQVKVQNAGLNVVDFIFQITLKRNETEEKKETAGQIQLDLLPVATGVIEYELPADNLNAAVNSKKNGLRRTGRKLLVPISKGGSYQIRWTAEGKQEARNTFFHVDSRSAVTVTDQGLSTVSDFNIAVRQGSINQITFKLPDVDSILAVAGPNIAGWQTVNENGTNELTIDFLQPVNSKAFVTVNRFRKAIVESVPIDFQVPIASAVGATRDSGTVAVLAERGFDVRVESLSSVSQINTESVQLPDKIESDSKRFAAAFRYTRQPAIVALKIGRDPVRRTVEFVNAVRMDLQRQRWTSLIKTKTTGTAVRQLQIALPPDFLVLDVQANDIADWYIDDVANEADSKQQRILTIQLSKARSGTMNAVIQGQTSRSADRRQETLIGPTLPTISVSEVDRFTGQLHVWLDDSSEISSIQADQWKRVPAGTSAPAEVRTLNSAAPAVSFTSTNASASEIQLNLRKAAPSLLAESVLVTNVTDTSLELSLALNWQISRAAAADFSFSIPSAVAAAFDFRIPGLRQLDQQVDADQTKYTIRLQQPITDKFFVMGTATLPLPTENQIQPFDVRFTVVDSSQAIISGQSHFWVLVNQSAGLLQLADIQSEPLEVESSELTTKIPAGFLQQSVSIQRCKAKQQTPAWKLSFPKSEQVTAAVVSLAAHRLIIAEDGSWKSHHVLQVRNEGRQFLPIVLPPDSEFLSCMVKGQPSRIVLQRSEAGVRSLIPIPQSGRVSTVFSVEFLLAGRLNFEPLNLSGQPLSLPLPVFPEFRDDPEYGITVARNTLKVFTPASWQTSLVVDPRITNVVEAAGADLEDAQLLSAVDNLRNLIDSAKSSKAGFNDAQLQAQFFDQKAILDDITGNSIGAITQRNELLNEVQRYDVETIIKKSETIIRQSQSSPLIRVQPQGNRNLQTRSLEKRQLGNAILLEEDFRQNRFVIDNNMSLYRTNGIRGEVQKNGQAKANPTFNFKLPDFVPDKPTPFGRNSPSKKMKTDPRSQSQNEMQRGQKGGASRSKLMLQQNESQLFKSGRNRESQQPRQSNFFDLNDAAGNRTDGVNITFGDNSTFPSPPAFDQSNETVQTEDNPTAPGMPQSVASDDQFQDGRNDQASASDPSGLLSLNFQLPESGTELDFIRTGGNPKLTLKVRSTKQVKTSYAWVWAAICVLLYFVIRRAVFKSPERMTERLLWISLPLVFVGWVLLPTSASIACLIATVVLAIAISALTIYQSVINSEAKSIRESEAVCSTD